MTSVGGPIVKNDNDDIEVAIAATDRFLASSLEAGGEEELSLYSGDCNILKCLGIKQKEMILSAIDLENERDNIEETYGFDESRTGNKMMVTVVLSRTIKEGI